MKSKNFLLATAPTLQDLEKSITRFFCGEVKILNEDGTMSSSLTGKVIPGMIWLKKGKRYRFEAVQS